jgi:hypothetical protein
MRPILAAVLLVGLLVPSALASDDIPPEKDSRLAKVRDAKPNKVGILTYYPNKEGGYTFLEEGQIVFYAVPYEPTTRQVENLVLPVIGPLKTPFGGQTVYRSHIMHQGFGEPHRVDTPIAKWTRDTTEGKFRLSILAEDSETRLKLKSIVPVREHGEHGK